MRRLFLTFAGCGRFLTHSWVVVVVVVEWNGIDLEIDLSFPFFYSSFFHLEQQFEM